MKNFLPSLLTIVTTWILWLARKECDVRCQDSGITAMVGCDDNLTLYVNEEERGTSSNFENFLRFNVTESLTNITIQCWNKQGFRGIFFNSSCGISTDASSWQCAPTECTSTDGATNWTTAQKLEAGPGDSYRYPATIGDWATLDLTEDVVIWHSDKNEQTVCCRRLLGGADADMCIVLQETTSQPPDDFTTMSPTDMNITSFNSSVSSGLSAVEIAAAATATTSGGGTTIVIIIIVWWRRKKKKKEAEEKDLDGLGEDNSKFEDYRRATVYEEPPDVDATYHVYEEPLDVESGHGFGHLQLREADPRQRNTICDETPDTNEPKHMEEYTYIRNSCIGMPNNPGQNSANRNATDQSEPIGSEPPLVVPPLLPPRHDPLAAKLN